MANGCFAQPFAAIVYRLIKQQTYCHSCCPYLNLSKVWSVAEMAHYYAIRIDRFTLYIVGRVNRDSLSYPNRTK
jgi:hypothetical protein